MLDSKAGIESKISLIDGSTSWIGQSDTFFKTLDICHIIILNEKKNDENLES